MPEDTGWMIGDVVKRTDVPGLVAGFVTGFCPGPQWVRVRTPDGSRRIWAKENLSNLDENLRAINRYMGIKGA